MKANNYLLLLNIFLILVCSQSCAQNKELLTEDEKIWNPYKQGQILIFESSNNEQDTVKIIDIQEVFPDGLGTITYNERLRVLARHNTPKRKGLIDTYIFSVIAQTDKHPTQYQFSIELENSFFIDDKYELKYLENLSEIEVQVKAGRYDDVIVIGTLRDYSHYKTAIEVIYWSKENGFIRLDKYDGSFWQLIEVINPDQ